MKSQRLNSGAIACSAAIIYGWAQAAISEPDRPTCEPPPTSPALAMATCSPALNLATLSDTPEPLLNLQWGDRPHQPDYALPPEMEAIYRHRLAQAQTVANREQFTAAINQIVGIPKNSRHYELAHQLQSDWSRQVMQQALDQWQQAKIKQALTLLAAIPAQSDLSESAQELRGQWQQQARQLDRAIEANTQGDWQGVITALKSLEDTPLYQSLRVQDLMQQAIARLYEPDQKLLQVAMIDLPAVNAGMAVPEMIERSRDPMLN